MSDENQNNKPDLFVYVVRETEEKNYFTKIGVAFAHSTGGGLTIDLSAHPIDRKLVLFPHKEDDASPSVD
ncbi:MAG: hypothetical protein AAF065_13230 [Verrucomicrobiota bacterium]